MISFILLPALLLNPVLGDFTKPFLNPDNPRPLPRVPKLFLQDPQMLERLREQLDGSMQQLEDPIKLLNDQLQINEFISRKSKLFSSSSIPADTTVGEVSLGQNRFLYTYINSSTLLTVSALVGGGFLLVALGLYLYDYFLLGGNSGYNRNDEYVSTQNGVYNSYGFDASRIKRRRYVTYSSRMFTYFLGLNVCVCLLVRKYWSYN